MTEETQNVCLVVEGLLPFSKKEVEGVVIELCDLVQKYCGGDISHFILNADRPMIEIS